MWTGKQRINETMVMGEDIVQWDKECRKIRAMEKRNNRKTKRWDS
jgi:hypothetical protein